MGSTGGAVSVPGLSLSTIEQNICKTFEAIR